MPRAPVSLLASATLFALLALTAAPALAEEATTTTGERPRALLLDLVSNGVDEDVVKTVGGVLAVELSHYDALDVLTSADIRRALELESERQMAGCDDTTCLSELAGALGADLVIYGDAGRLGSLLVVNLSLFDQKALRSIGRVSVRAETLERLPELLRPKLADLLAPWYEARGLALERPVAAPSSSVPPLLPWTVAGAGGALVVAGAVLLGVGSLPWFSFQQHASALASLEGEGPSSLAEARDVHAAQELARRDWDAWGGPLVGVGAVTLGVGVTAAAGGLAWALLTPEGASE